MNITNNLKKQPNYIKTCYTILNPIKSMTKFSYATLSSQTKENLVLSSPRRIIELAKSACCLAENIKIGLDSKYGDKNYTLISLGRSMSAICEIVQDLGGNVKFIPLSTMKIRTNYSDDSIKVLKNYLESIGLTKKSIEKDPRHKYILFDYANSGESLKNASILLTRCDLLGPQRNIESIEANCYIKSSFKNLFYHSRFKHFSPVGKLPNKNLEDIFTQASPDTAKEYSFNMAKIVRKLFRFNVLNCLDEKKYQIDAPKLELKMLERYRTQKYLKYVLSKISWNVLADE